MMSNTKVVRNYNDANVLIEKGYKLLKIDRNKNDRRYLIFIFEYSEELIQELRDLSLNK